MGPQKKRSTVSKFGTKILQRVFEKTLMLFFFIRSRFFKIYFQIFLSCIIVQDILSFHDSLHLYVVLQAYNSKVWHEDTKEGFWEDFEAIFSKIVLNYLQVHIKFGCVFAINNLSLYIKNCDRILDTSKFWIFVWAIYRLKNDQLSRNLDMFFQ